MNLLNNEPSSAAEMYCVWGELLPSMLAGITTFQLVSTSSYASASPHEKELLHNHIQP